MASARPDFDGAPGPSVVVSANDREGNVALLQSIANLATQSRLLRRNGVVRHAASTLGREMHHADPTALRRAAETGDAAGVKALMVAALVVTSAVGQALVLAAVAAALVALPSVDDEAPAAQTIDARTLADESPPGRLVTASPHVTNGPPARRASVLAGVAA